MTKNESEINENTKIRLGIILSCGLAIAGALVTATMLYAEHKDLPVKVKALSERQIEQCFFMKNLQDHLLKPNERYPLDCIHQKDK